MLDDLRRSTLDDDFEEIKDEDDDFVIDDRPASRRTFLGMTAVERMFLAIFLFLNVIVLGLGFLIATGRIVL